MIQVRPLRIEDRLSLSSMLEEAGLRGWAKDYQAWREPVARGTFDPDLHGPRRAFFATQGLTRLSHPDRYIMGSELD